MVATVLEPRRQRLARYLPRFVSTAAFFAALQRVEGAEFDALAATVEQAPLQTAATLATWGVDRLERDYGLPDGAALPLAERRSRVLALMRANRTATPAAIKNLALSFENGDIELDEDFNGSTLTIRFVDARGQPPNLGAMQAALRAAVPDHLALVFVIRYRIWDETDTIRSGGPETWDQIDAAGRTWNDHDVLRPY